jgi:phage repressor protein C with HTH and peptisase S24 domain
VSFYDNYERLCREKGKSPSSLADELGFNRSTVSGWKRNGAKPRPELAMRIADYFGISVTELMGGAERIVPEKEKPPAENPAGVLYQKMDTEDKATYVDFGHRLLSQDKYGNIVELPKPKIRHYLNRAAAGYISPVEGEDYEIIDLPDNAPGGADFCVDIDGDSMEPYILDGQTVYVQRTIELRDFEPGIFFLDGEVFCKQFCPGYGGQCYLLSANPKRQDANKVVTRDMHLECFGRVLLPIRLPKPRYY